MSIQSLKDRVPTAAVPGRWPDNSICVQQIDTNDHIIVIVIFWCPVWRLTRSLCINKSRLGNWDVMYLVPLAGNIQYIHTIYILYIYRHKLPITHCCCSVSACMMMMSVFCLLPASAAVQFVACAHLPITGAEEQILSCLEIITSGSYLPQVDHFWRIFRHRQFGGRELGEETKKSFQERNYIVISRTSINLLIF